MKTLILTQNVIDIDGMKAGLAKAQAQLYILGLGVEFTYEPTIKQFTSLSINTDVVQNGYEVNPTEILQEAQGGWDIVCLIYDWNFIWPHPTNPCVNPMKGEVPMQIPVNWYTDSTVTPHITYSEVLSEFFLHEMSHILAYKSGQKDNTHYKYNSEFSQFWQKSNSEFYLFLIKGYLQSMPPNTQQNQYKYFQPNEIVGLKPELVTKLDQARGFSGIPYKITSGFRDPTHNASVGGVQGSTHTLGLGCDILADDSTKRFKIVSGALQAGFNRIGVYSDHVHLDCGSLPDFPQNVLWESDKE